MRLRQHALILAGMLLSLGLMAQASAITYNFSGEFYNQYAKYSTKHVPTYFDVSGWMTSNFHSFDLTVTAGDASVGPFTISSSAPKDSKFVAAYFPYSPKWIDFEPGEYNATSQDLYLEFDNGIPGTADSESDFYWDGEFWDLNSGGALTPAPVNPASPVPEPASGVLFLTGVLLLGLGLAWRQRHGAATMLGVA